LWLWVWFPSPEGSGDCGVGPCASAFCSEFVEIAIKEATVIEATAEIRANVITIFISLVRLDSILLNYTLALCFKRLEKELFVS